MICCCNSSTNVVRLSNHYLIVLVVVCLDKAKQDYQLKTEKGYPAERKESQNRRKHQRPIHSHSKEYHRNTKLHVMIYTQRTRCRSVCPGLALSFVWEDFALLVSSISSDSYISFCFLICGFPDLWGEVFNGDIPFIAVCSKESPSE